MNFKIFLENLETNSKDIRQCIKKLPKKHADLIKDYKIKFEPNNTLKKSNKHVGFIDEEKKTISVAAPWNYSRSFTLLHEIAHAVWKNLADEQKEEWKKIFLKEKNKMKNKSLNQNYEEIFAMAYANFYSKHKLLTYENKSWNKFIRKI
jgi:hypothetical protein